MGIKNIHSLLKMSQQHFNQWAEDNTKGINGNLMDRLNSEFFKLLDQYTIARSREHIKEFYDINAIGKFPDRLKPISIYSELDTKKKIMSFKEMNEVIENLKMAIFYPSNYFDKRKSEDVLTKHDTRVKEGKTVLSQKDREFSLVKMMKINYLKRMESSINSFALSLERLVYKIDKLIEKIENYIDKKDIYKDLLNKKENINKHQQALFINEDNDEDEEELEEELADLIVGGKIEYNLLEMKASDWLKDLRNDKKHLEKLLKEAQMIDSERDKKLQTLIEKIEDKINNPINNGNKKVLVFTAYYDTAIYLYNNIKIWAKEKGINIAMVSGGNTCETSFGGNKFEDILTNFSPISKGRKDIPIMCESSQEIDILIATDCISEGQNLQDCDFLVNYDIHWNPVRIIQRFGRIDRLGSKNNKIQLVNFWATKDLNEYINIEDRVKNRMHLLNIGSTGDENIFENEKQEENADENELNFRHKQLLRLKDEVLDIEDMNESVSLTDFSLNDFRIELANFIENNKELIEKTPKGIYAVVPALSGEFGEVGNYNFEKIGRGVECIKSGVIFCLKLKEDKFKEKKDKKENKFEKFNPISPYFLAYVYDDGQIKYSFSNIKQILEIYKLLCHGKKEAFTDLCKTFDKNTDDGNNMTKYNDLILKMVESIKSNTQKKALKSIGVGAGRGAINLIGKNEKIKSEEEFDLISFLVIL